MTASAAPGPSITLDSYISPGLCCLTIALIKLAETLGNKLREPHSKALGEGLFELRRNQVRPGFWAAW